MPIPALMSSAATCLSAAAIFVLTVAGDVTRISDRTSREMTVKVLQPLAALVGEWKGVGQPKRGSNAGAWSEKATAAWRFEENSTDLILTFEPGQQFHSAAFSVSTDGKTPLLNMTPLNGQPVQLTRTKAADNKNLSDDSWIFESAPDTWPQTRCTIRMINDIRVIFLFEEKPTEKAAYRRLSEIGLTRVGAKLARGNTGERQCVVTGGLGTIKVAHEGKTFYVCCEGCKQAFDADPAGTLEAYHKRLKGADSQ